MNEYFDIIQEAFVNYGPWIVFPLLLLENFPFIGFFTPAITTLIIAGFMLASNAVDFAVIACVAYFGILVGDNLWFWIGRISSGKWRALEKVNSRANTLLDVVKNQHIALLLLYQFPPYFRMFLPFAFGVGKVAMWKWMLINMIGSVLYVAMFMGIGMFSYKSMQGIASGREMGEVVSYGLTVFALIYLVVLIAEYVQRRRREVD